MSITIRKETLDELAGAKAEQGGKALVKDPALASLQVRPKKTVRREMFCYPLDLASSDRGTLTGRVDRRKAENNGIEYLVVEVSFRNQRAGSLNGQFWVPADFLEEV